MPMYFHTECGTKYNKVLLLVRIFLKVILMSALISTITQKRQVTIPKNIRDSLHLLAGDKVEFIRNGQGEVLIRTVTYKVAEVAGILNQYKQTKPVSVAEMDEAIARHIKDENRR